ncbi:cytochrome c oxidase subunit 5C-like [Momordica charantia]|uniref:Cytochrome c oxidase subunit 5C-like n=1 Tax=Momordica charantia TaxID=3673 RepID=A0A6J1DP17_MOMCH|nr:cytochrome c oxidase subunit 5C-like [Momordica charantia]
MAGKIVHATLKGPSIVKEICAASALALFAGSFWKIHQWNEQKRVKSFYDLLEKGEIAVIAQEE